MFVSCSIGDSTPPTTITNLSLSSEELTRILTWTAPGDNGNQGTATIYFPRYFSDTQVAAILGLPNLNGVSSSEIQSAVQDNFNNATQVPDFQVPLPGGSAESFLTPRLDITGQTSYFYSLRTNDKVGNSSEPSNVVELTTPLQNIRYVSSEPGSCVGESVASGNFHGQQITQNICIIPNNQYPTCLNSGLLINNNDIAVGDPCVGKVYIFFGNNNLTDNGNPLIDVSSANVTIIGNASDGFGASLAKALNFYGQGRPDELIIGAPDFNNKTGKVYVLLGNFNFPSVVNLTDGSTEHIEIEGENQGDNFGFNVLNGQGILNASGIFAASAPFNNSDTGRVYLYVGSQLSTSNVNQATVSHVIITGQQTGGQFGFSTANLGTIIINGYSALGVGAPGLGRAYTIFGGEIQSIDLATNTSNALILQGNASDGFGMSISGGGLILNGFNGSQNSDDVIVGAPESNNKTGSVFLYSGVALSNNHNDHTTPVAETEFTGLNPGDLFGTSVSVFPILTPNLIAQPLDTAIVLQYEMINADFAVGAPGVSPGSVYIFYGQSSFPATVSASAAKLTLAGQAGDSDFGSVVMELNDINGDQLDDFGVGGTGFINIYY